jgi:hypothetical protein
MERVYDPVPQLRTVMDMRLTAMRMENEVETAMRKEIAPPEVP